jgi:hypothetical protein
MKPAMLLTTVLLITIALLHLARLIGGIEVTAGTVVIPMWASVVATVVCLGLAFGLWRESHTSDSTSA